MVYFLGRDVSVGITTEGSASGTGDGLETNSLGVTTGTTASATVGGGDINFASLRTAAPVDVTDLTGVDLSIGAMDEDITYFGFRSVTKAEIKKETTISLTRKKSDVAWDIIFQDARWGVKTSSLQDGLTYPNIATGFRIYVTLNGTHEVFTVMGACVQSHTVSVNADGSTEETLEFMSYITPAVGTVANKDVLTVSDL